MTEINYGIIDLKYGIRQYTNHIVNFGKHVDRLVTDYVIDNDRRVTILQQLDTLVKLTITLYHRRLQSINFPADQPIPDNYNDDINLLEQINKSTFENRHDPLYDIRTKLLELSKRNGFSSIHDFLTFYIGNGYINLLNKIDLEIFQLYNKIFIPLTIFIKNTPIASTTKFLITKTYSNCDSLIDNTCRLTLTIHNFPVKIVFEGYVAVDVVNMYVRISKIYSKYIFDIKTATIAIITNQYPQVTKPFLMKYLKFVNGSSYFVNTPEEFANKIVDDYTMFIDLTSKTFNLITKEFVKGDVSHMYQMINLLLMGNDHQTSTAILLYNLLKDKKSNGYILGAVIHRNLSYCAQSKLKSIDQNMKEELTRIKTLTVEDISIEKRLTALVNMPDNVKNYILDKVYEIKTSENNYKLQMAINGLMSFPWKPKNFENEYVNIRKSMMESRSYLHDVASKLDKAIYGHETSKKLLIELVGKWIQNPESTGRVIGLVGPPGVGKTLLAKSISTALNIPLSIVGLGGMNDSADLIGHSFTYSGSQYGMILKQMIKAGNWRCVLFFDEVDKVAKRNDINEIYSILIHITDPNMNQHFQDRFYSSSIDFDLSGALIVFSYNNSDKLDPILLDRIKEIPISPYSIQEKIIISQDYILKELCEDINFDKSKIAFDDETIRYIIEHYTLEAGVRELHRKLEQILLKLNIDRFYMRGPFESIINDIDPDDAFNWEFDKIVITEDLVHRYLEKPTITFDKIHGKNLVGVINGLYATKVGIGGLVPIQISANHIGSNNKNFKLKLTGNQKNIMRESVMCALTIAIGSLNDDIRTNVITKFPHGFHIHAPDGGTPKDGPSAGCAFAVAFVSILINKKINRTIAITGEIDLTGKVRRIGSLDVKLIGAHKAGVKCVYISHDNKSDYELVKKKNPELFTEDFQIKPVNNFIELVTDPNVIINVDSADFNPLLLKNN